MAPAFTQLTPHLWVQQSQLYYTNSGLFLSQGQAGLIDPCIFPGEIKAMADFLAQHNANPHVLLLTHSHWDHIFGPEHFPGVKIIAQENYIEIVQAHGQDILSQIEVWEKEHEIHRDTPFTIPRPDETFKKTMTLTVGDLSLTLIHVPGHAADQLAAYHTDSATLWASDILSDVEIPFISHGLAPFQQTLAHLSTLDLQVLVPGHGHATTDPADIRARFSEDMVYLDSLREKIGGAIQQGKSIEETVALCADIPYRFPETNEIPHRLNVESVYLELGGEADPKKVGWKKEWD